MTNDAIDDVDVGTGLSEATERERVVAADSLRRWITESNPTNKAILERLEKDIRDDSQMERWAAFALEDLIRPPLAIASETWQSRLARGIELFRNIALFFPVMVTWFAIDVASDAYSKYLEKEWLPELSAGEPSKSFLQIWNDPSKLDKLLGLFKPTLQTIAFVDGILIVILILSTILVHFFDAKAEEISRQKDLQNDLALRGVMVDVGLFLHGFRQITPSQLKSGLSEAVNSLARATESIRDTSAGLKQVADSAHVTLAKFADLSSRELEPAVKRIDSIVGSLSSAASAHETLGDMVRNLQRDLGSSLEVITRQMDTLGRVLDGRLEENTVKLERAMQAIVRETEGVVKRLADANSASHEVIELMRQGLPKG
jgi:hypothetical protein